MNDLFTRYWEETPVKLTVAPRAIRPVQKPAPLPVARAAQGPGAECAFVNAERNSRSPLPFIPLQPGQQELRIRWRVDLPGSLRPSTLLVARDRALVYGTSDWQLFDTDGRFVKAGPLRASDVLLDAERETFYAADQFGLIPARRLADGQAAFSVSLYHGKKFARRFVGRRGRLLVTLGTEMAVDAHKPPPEYSIVEITDLGDPKNPKSWNEEGGPAVVKDIIRKTDWMLAAMHADAIVLATHDRVYLLDLELEIRQALTGTFSPSQLSVDEAGRIYLVVEAAGRNALWLLTPEGDQLYSFELPQGAANVSRPPVIGYNHTAYLITAQHLLAVATDGKLEWSRAAAGHLAGAVVTANDQLLVSEGSEVALYNLKGERRRVYSFTGEQLATPPIPTNTGDLMVASETSLYCLSVKR